MENFREAYGIITGVVFLIDFFGLAYSTCGLMKTLKREFSSNL